ncbi:MAG: HAMP domain-containing protein [Alphaproteobacteria bacterium]|nr:MAG: HAMP domain-containing protein [Alphaproteobacteria bacterium]
MSAASHIGRSGVGAGQDGRIVVGEDYVEEPQRLEGPLATLRRKKSLLLINRSPLARKIVLFNLMALVILVAGVLYLNPFRDSLVVQRERDLVAETHLVADVFEAYLATAEALDPVEVLANIRRPGGVRLYVLDVDGRIVADSRGIAGQVPPPVEGLSEGIGSSAITDFLNDVWSYVADRLQTRAPVSTESMDEKLRELAMGALDGVTRISSVGARPGAGFTVASPIFRGNEVVGVIAATASAAQIDALVRAEREQVLQMFVIALLVSIGLSLVLASTIANPLADLAAAAELGRQKNARKLSPDRIRIPDLTARPDEIGRLSGALRGMVAALYDRIETNEQFAADVAHEIKNPLSSLRSAVDTLRIAKKDEQKKKLLDVIEHDVRRLDRLVSDISNASRLDSELVKEEEEEFDLTKLLENIIGFQKEEAARKGVDFITDIPKEPIIISGLEGRLAQVFVNIISNAISFCEEGDAVRVWARRRENRVLVVVEDTGPGIPEEALSKIFKRFYSERPPGQFGNHSGLGLAISKQIVEAHGGAIWAENIRPTDADATSEPLGARFVVGLPI